MLIALVAIAPLCRSQPARKTDTAALTPRPVRTNGCYRNARQVSLYLPAAVLSEDEVRAYVSTSGRLLENSEVRPGASAATMARLEPQNELNAL